MLQISATTKGSFQKDLVDVQLVCSIYDVTKQELRNAVKQLSYESRETIVAVISDPLYNTYCSPEAGNSECDWLSLPDMNVSVTMQSAVRNLVLYGHVFWLLL